MAENTSREGEPRAVRTLKPGDRVLRVRTRRTRLPLIERRVGGPLVDAFDFFAELATQTPVVGMVVALLILVALAPIPVFLFEREAEGAQMTSYWIGLWWAVSAFTTVGHSNIEVMSLGGRVIGSLYTITAVGLFFGSVIAAFSSYFLLTWRRPKRQLIDTITYYLQRIDELDAAELEDLDDMTQGLLRIARERAQAKEQPGTPPASN